MFSHLDKTAASTTAEAAKAKAAVSLVRRLQSKMKLMQGENEQLKREVSDLKKTPSHGPTQTPETPQPRDNSVEVGIICYLVLLVTGSLILHVDAGQRAFVNGCRCSFNRCPSSSARIEGKARPY